MQVEIIMQPRSTLSEFAIDNGLTMEVRERDPQYLRDEGSRYYAMFKSAEVKDGACLRGTFGNGSTVDMAISDYAREISGKTLVIDAYKESRREIKAPILTHN